MHNGRRVVVTGMGAITPLGNSPASFWEAMMRSESGAAPISLFDPEPFETQFACEVKGFDANDHLGRKMARRLDRFAQFGMVVAEQAVVDAGLDGDLPQELKDRIGVVFGSGIGGLKKFQEQTTVHIQEGPRRISPFFIPMMIPDIASGHISMRYGFRGPNYCIVSACATGNNNIGDAALLIQRGSADAILCGGTEASVTELGVGGFNALKALSTRNDDPAAASRPFDADRDGFVLGEGAGALILEDLEHAKERGATIYAEIIGVGMSGDAYHITAPDPAGGGAGLGVRS
ncbi:MAG: beta-ketoacyl-ACP synthase II, partial [Rhodothermales bacterium]